MTYSQERASFFAIVVAVLYVRKTLRTYIVVMRVLFASAISALPLIRAVSAISRKSVFIISVFVEERENWQSVQ